MVTRDKKWGIHQVHCIQSGRGSCRRLIYSGVNFLLWEQACWWGAWPHVQQDHSWPCHSFLMWVTWLIVGCCFHHDFYTLWRYVEIHQHLCSSSVCGTCYWKIEEIHNISIKFRCPHVIWPKLCKPMSIIMDYLNFQRGISQERKIRWDNQESGIWMPILNECAIWLFYWT